MLLGHSLASFCDHCMITRAYGAIFASSMCAECEPLGLARPPCLLLGMVTGARYQYPGLLLAEGHARPSIVDKCAYIAVSCAVGGHMPQTRGPHQNTWTNITTCDVASRTVPYKFTVRLTVRTIELLFSTVPGAVGPQRALRHNEPGLCLARCPTALC